MAVYHTLFIECYGEQDALRLQEQLKRWSWQVNGQIVEMANIGMETHNGFWNVHANPKGPGYSSFGYGDGMNDPSVLALLEECLFRLIAKEPGIRRAACGYEAQDWFVDGLNNWNLEELNLPSLLFDRHLTPQPPGADIVEFGPLYYRTPSRYKRNAA